MKQILLILTIFLCFVAIEMNAQGDYTPCLPDCENDVWIPNISLPALSLFVTIPGCTTTFEIRYRYRVACNQWYDYYLEGVASTGSPYDIKNCIDNGYSGSMALFMQAISEQLMLANPANFPPHTVPNCEDMWRVIKGGCWYRDFVTGTGGGGPMKPDDLLLSGPGNPYEWGAPELLAPCPSVLCCLEKYRLCRTPQGLVITLTDYQPPIDPECESTSYYNCTPICGSVYHR